MLDIQFEEQLLVNDEDYDFIENDAHDFNHDDDYIHNSELDCEVFAYVYYMRSCFF